MTMTGKLQGRRVLVTGAGTGIGQGIAIEFARAGAAVAVHYSHSDAGARATVADIEKAGGKAAAFRADFAQVAEVQRLAKDALVFLGGLDVLVNNAAITLNRPIEKVSQEQFDLLYAVNVRAPFFLVQATLPALLKSPHAAIVNISSIHAFEGYTEHAVYAGTRGAMVSFTRELAIELGPRGIRVNGIAPGAVPVENQYKIMPGLDPVAAGRNIPIGHVGTPADIGKVAVFLASEEARYILGQTLVVDGGTTSWMPFGEQFRQPLTAQFGTGYVPGL